MRRRLATVLPHAGEPGARRGEALGLTGRRIGADTIAFAEQLSRRSGELAPLKTRRSRRTVEVTRALAAELRLAAGSGRVFAGLDHGAVERSWRVALKRVGLADPQPVIHDVRHTHVSVLIADGWHPVEVAAPIGDTLATTLRVYAHEPTHGAGASSAAPRWKRATEMAT